MKLTIEITDKDFKYSYEVGETRNSGSQPINPDSMIAFVQALEIAVRHRDYEDKVWEREITAKAWLEKTRGEK